MQPRDQAALAADQMSGDLDRSPVRPGTGADMTDVAEGLGLQTRVALGEEDRRGGGLARDAGVVAHQPVGIMRAFPQSRANVRTRSTSARSVGLASPIAAPTLWKPSTQCRRSAA